MTPLFLFFTYAVVGYGNGGSSPHRKKDVIQAEHLQYLDYQYVDSDDDEEYTVRPNTVTASKARIEFLYADQCSCYSGEIRSIWAQWTRGKPIRHSGRGQWAGEGCINIPVPCT